MVVFLSVTASTVWGAFEERVRGARLAGLAGASSGLPGEIWTIPTNPATAGTVLARSLAISVNPRPFGLAELSSVDFAFLQPFKPGSLAVTGSVFGSDLYRETTVSLSAAGSLFKRFEVGVALTAYALSIRDYGSAWTLGVTAGILVHLSERLFLGLSVQNINEPAIGSVRELLPQSMHAGMSYQPLPGFLIAADIAKDILFPADLAIGFEYAPLEAFLFRGGTTLNPSTFSAGVGIRTTLLRLDYALAAHPDLGLSHVISFAIVLEEW